MAGRWGEPRQGRAIGASLSFHGFNSLSGPRWWRADTDPDLAATNEQSVIVQPFGQEREVGPESLPGEVPRPGTPQSVARRLDHRTQADSIRPDPRHQPIVIVEDGTGLALCGTSHDRDLTHGRPSPPSRDRADRSTSVCDRPSRIARGVRRCCTEHHSDPYIRTRRVSLFDPGLQPRSGFQEHPVFIAPLGRDHHN